MALIDVLRKKPNQAQPAAITAGQVQEQAATGATGKAQVPATGPATSNIAGQLAGQQMKQAGEGLATEQALAGTQLAQQAEEQKAAQALQAQGQQIQREEALKDITAKEQMTGQRLQTQAEMERVGRGERERSFYTNLNNQYANTLADLASQRGIVENDLFQNLSQEMESLSDAQSASRLEQLAHSLAMSDRSYMDEIEMIGAERGLRDELAFKREANQLVFGKNLEILNKRLDAESLLNADAREFKRAMAEIDINTAIEIAQQAAKAQAAANIIQGGVILGTQAAMKYGSTPETDVSFREEYGISPQGSSTFGGPR